VIPVNSFPFAILTILIAFAVSYALGWLLGALTPPRRKTMTPVSYTKDDLASTQPVAVPGDAQTSLNDYNGAREQDQGIAQLVAQLDTMGEHLWDCASPQGVQEKLNGVSNLARFSFLLSAISLPMAAVGEVRGNSAAGSSHYVNAGNRRVACDSKQQAAEVAKAITEGTWRVLAPLRALYLLNIQAIASGEGVGQDVRDWTTFSCGNQHVAKAPDQDSANAYVEALNEVYLDAIHGAKHDIMMDLLALAGKS
jgi:hypothetical protein